MLSDFFFYVFKIVGFYFYVDSKIESAEISHLPQFHSCVASAITIPNGIFVIIGELHWYPVVHQSL